MNVANILSESESSVGKIMKLDKTADKFVKLFAAEILITSGKSALHLQKKPENCN